MKFSESIYSRKNRPYYRGLPYNILDYTKSRYNCVYFTNYFVYAVMYSYKGGHDFGAVYEYHLTDDINIFNANNNRDVLKLKVEIKRELENTKSEFYEVFSGYKFDNTFFYKLGHYDWTSILGGDELRDLFLTIVKKAGFEGFFNFEWHKKSLEHDGITFGKEIENMPSIGVFNPEKLKPTKKYTYNDYFQFPDFVRAHDMDAEKLKQFLSNIYNNGDDLYEDHCWDYAEDLLFLDYEDIVDIISDPDELDENYKHTPAAERFKQLLESRNKFGMKYHGIYFNISGDTSPFYKAIKRIIERSNEEQDYYQ